MKIAIAGASGRMGQMLIRQIAHTEGCSLAGAIEGAGSNALGRDAGEVAGVGAKGVKIAADAAAAIGAAVWQAMQNAAASPTPSSATGEEAPSRWKNEGRKQQLDRTP